MVLSVVLPFEMSRMWAKPRQILFQVALWIPCVGFLKHGVKTHPRTLWCENRA